MSACGGGTAALGGATSARLGRLFCTAHHGGRGSGTSAVWFQRQPPRRTILVCPDEELRSAQAERKSAWCHANSFGDASLLFSYVLVNGKGLQLMDRPFFSVICYSQSKLSRHHVATILCIAIVFCHSRRKSSSARFSESLLLLPSLSAAPSAAASAWRGGSLT